MASWTIRAFFHRAIHSASFAIILSCKSETLPTGGVTAVAGNIVVNGAKLHWSGDNQVANTASITLNSGTLETKTDTVANVTINGTNSDRTTWIHKLTITDTLKIAGGTPYLGSTSTTTANKVVMTTGGEIEMAAHSGDTTMNIGSGGLSMSDAVWHLGISSLNSPKTALINLDGDFEGSGTNRIKYYTTDGPRLLDLKDATRTFDITNGTTTIDATIQNGGLIKDGDGTLVLKGTLPLKGENIYAGDTTVQAGTLLVNGTHTAGGDYEVQAGATLGGTGTIGALIDVLDDGILAPGASTGTLYTDDIEFSSGSFFDVEIGGPNAGAEVDGYDQLAVSGTVDLGGATLNLSLLDGYLPGVGDAFYLLVKDDTEYITGTFTFNGDSLDEGEQINLGSTLFLATYRADWLSGAPSGGNDFALMAVPEPSTFLLAALGLLGLLFRGRRRKRTA